MAMMKQFVTYCEDIGVEADTDDLDLLAQWKASMAGDTSTELLALLAASVEAARRAR